MEVKPLKRFQIIALSIFFILCTPILAFAGIDYTMDDSPSFKKVINWSCSEDNAEYRYIAREASESDYESAIPVGTGGNASITVTDNGIYSLFAKAGDVIHVVTVPVVTIDKNGPDITLTGVTRNSDGTVTVTYEASDYFGVADTRIGSGSLSASAFDSAAPISGGVIKGLNPGIYTIFAKDLAGNVTIYPLTVEAASQEWSTEYSESNEWSTEWSTEWGSNWLYYDYEDPVIVLVSKCDFVTGEELAGAKLTISDKSGNVIHTWVTNGTQTQIKISLEPGKTYILSEEYAPEGYEIADSIEFTVKDDGSITHVIMYDRPKKEPGPNNSQENATLSPKDDPVETVAQVKKMPQTGGIMDTRVISLSFSLVLIIGGFVVLIGMKRYGKKR